jgi:hypothetical protein
VSLDLLDRDEQALGDLFAAQPSLHAQPAQAPSEHDGQGLAALRNSEPIWTTCLGYRAPRATRANIRQLQRFNPLPIYDPFSRGPARYNPFASLVSIMVPRSMTTAAALQNLWTVTTFHFCILVLVFVAKQTFLH